MRTLILALAAAGALAACGPKATPLTQLTADQLWERGLAAFQDEDWTEALRYFDRFVLAGGADPRITQARYYVGEAHFRKKQYVTAAAEFTRLAADLGFGELADDARFMACRAYEELSPDPQLDQEYTRAALDHCRALAEFFPESEFTPRANAIVERMHNRLAAKVYEGGDWYLRRRALDSAIIYFEDVVEQFPRTAYAPKALLRLVEIYDRLEYDEEAAQARARLLEEYPGSPEAAQVRPG